MDCVGSLRRVDAPPSFAQLGVVGVGVVAMPPFSLPPQLDAEQAPEVERCLELKPKQPSKVILFLWRFLAALPDICNLLQYQDSGCQLVQAKVELHRPLLPMTADR